MQDKIPFSDLGKCTSNWSHTLFTLINTAFLHLPAKAKRTVERYWQEKQKGRLILKSPLADLEI